MKLEKLHDASSAGGGRGQNTIKGGQEVDRLALLIVDFAAKGWQTRNCEHRRDCRASVHKQANPGTISKWCWQEM
jgi:hypothetical protein